MLQEAQETTNKMTIKSVALSKCIGAINECISSDDRLDALMLRVQYEKLLLLLGAIIDDIETLTTDITTVMGDLVDECGESTDL